MATRVRSFCKINLGLAVGPPRADGFHGLTTLYQTLGLHDFVTVTATRAASTQVKITANHKWVPCSASGNAEKNTAYKIIALALLRLGLNAEVEIRIDKRLPVQGGLGAGSANAAAALLGLERELSVALAGAERMALAAEVGSDVPLFLLGGTVLGYDRGQLVSPVPDFPAMHCVVAVPSVGVSTAQAFRDLDARTLGTGTRERDHSGGAGRADTALTFAQVPSKLEELSRAYAGIFTISGVEPGVPEIPTGNLGGTTGITGRTSGLAEELGSSVDLSTGVSNPLFTLVRTGIENDFEEVVFSQHPSLRSIKRDLVGEGPSSALYASLSGSGSASFGLYRSESDAIAAQQRVQSDGTNGIQALLTKTVPRPEYWASMFAE